MVWILNAPSRPQGLKEEKLVYQPTERWWKSLAGLNLWVMTPKSHWKTQIFTLRFITKKSYEVATK